jgi:hypothetical protein
LALEKVIGQLVDQLESLRLALDALSYPLLIDTSRTDDLAISGYSGDALTEVADLLRRAIPAAISARKAANYPVDLDGVKSALVSCQDKVAGLGKRFRDGLISVENVDTLSRLKRRGGQWAKWAETVVKGLQESQEALRVVNETILLCWQEIAERAGNVSVRTTAIGKKVVNVSDGKQRIGEGMT